MTVAQFKKCCKMLNFQNFQILFSTLILALPFGTVHSDCLAKCLNSLLYFTFSFLDIKFHRFLPWSFLSQLKTALYYMLVLKCILILALCTCPFSYSFLHTQTYPPHNVVHKVISSVFHPYTLTKCCLPLFYPRLDQMLKHMTPRLYSGIHRDSVPRNKQTDPS